MINNIIQQIAEKPRFSEDFARDQSEYAPSKNMFAGCFLWVDGAYRKPSSDPGRDLPLQTHRVIRNLAREKDPALTSQTPR
ncbi:MAG: hypothetical protein ACLUD0_09845 [Eubacterium ramulus]